MTRIACMAIYAIFMVGCGASSDGDGHDKHQVGFTSGHSHEHSGAESLRGGTLVPIGHSHHPDGVTHYYAEVMPAASSEVSLYLLTTANGKTIEFPIEDAEIHAYLDDINKDAALATDVQFKAAGDSPSAKFTVKLPEETDTTSQLSIVIPKIKLGGERQRFSFIIPPAADEDEDDDEDESSSVVDGPSTTADRHESESVAP